MVQRFRQEDINAFTSILFRSSYYALSGYFIAFLLERAIMFASAAIYRYSIIFNYEYLKIKGYTHSWTQDTVLIIYLFPYFIIATIIVWLHIKYWNIESKLSYKPVFIYWLMLFFSYRLIGILPAHLYSFTGIHHAFNWLYFGMTVKVLISLAAMALFFITSIRLYNQIFYLSGLINNNLKTLGLKRLLLAALLAPAGICCAVAILFFSPGLPKEEMLGLIFIVLPVIYTSIRLFYYHPMIASIKNLVEEKLIQWQIFSVILALIIVVRVLLGIGISVN